MIWLFNLLVFGLLLVVALHIFLEYRESRRRSPVACGLLPKSWSS